MIELSENSVFIGISKHTPQELRRLTNKFEVRREEVIRRREGGFRGNPSRGGPEKSLNKGIEKKRKTGDFTKREHLEESLISFYRPKDIRRKLSQRF